MRVVVQRVLQASVTVSQSIISKIGPGLLLLVGIESNDTLQDLEFIVKKVLKMRLFESQDKFWALNVKDAQLEILSVSQFTLYGNCYKGNKPDFHAAMPPQQAQKFYGLFLEKLKSEYSLDKVKDGQFGAKMVLHTFINDNNEFLVTRYPK